MAMDEKGLGKLLQQKRQAAGMTQQMLCQAAGLSYSTLTKIERGAIKSPSIFTIQSIAEALNIGLDELISTKSENAQDTRKRSKSGISFVYFDINGCLVRFYHRAFTRIASSASLPPDFVETTYWHYNDQVCRGEMSMAQFNVEFAKKLQIPSMDWQAYYFEAIEPMPEMHELVRWAKKYFGVGLLTNIMPGLVDEMLKRGYLPNVSYDTIIDSSAVHTIKPEPRIYEIACNRANTPASDILFIDDSRANLMAAEKFGWRVLWFDNYRPEEAIERIHKVLEFED